MDNKQTGNYGEELACKYLQKLGYKILERNFRIRGGEIDIVAKDKEYLVFVEVKTRYTHEYGSPVESITPWKVKALRKTALFYVVKNKWANKPFRIDVIVVDFLNSKRPEVDLIKNITL